MKNLLIINFFAIAFTIKSQTVEYGRQIWMTENLNVDTFQNGEIIPEVRTYSEWMKAAENKQPAWCYYNNNLENGAKYGKLYNWYAVTHPFGLPPKGWSVPTDRDWMELINFLGGIDSAVERLKSRTGFDGQLGGCRINAEGAEFANIELFGYYWSTSGYYLDGVYYNAGNLLGNFKSMKTEEISEEGKSLGFSLRCIKNNSNSENFTFHQGDTQTYNVFKRLQGPEGCDATSIFMDSKKRLWLGTGSSGGVYLFDSNKKEWKELNTGIGPVHVADILEIENKIIIEIFDVNKKYRTDNNSEWFYSENLNAVAKYYYLDNDEWKPLGNSFIGIVKSEIENKNKIKQNKLLEFEAKYRNIIGNLQLNIIYINSLNVIDNILYILDKRGLYYFDFNHNKIKKYYTKGLNATDVYQIIPAADNRVYIWTNCCQLIEYTGSNFKQLFELPYNIGIIDNKTPFYSTRYKSEFQRYLIDCNESLNNLKIDYRKKFNIYKSTSYYNISLNFGKFQEHGYITNENNKFLVSILGSLYSFDKLTGYLSIIDDIKDESGLNYFINEALFDIDGSIVAGVYADNGNLIPVRFKKPNITPYSQINYTELPGLRFNNVVYCNETPLSLSAIDNKNINFKDNVAISYDINRNNFSVLSLANGNLNATLKLLDGYCEGRNEPYRYFNITPQNGINDRIISFYDDEKGNVYIGTGGSGLLIYKYR